jgi:hypothetical protein
MDEVTLNWYFYNWIEDQEEEVKKNENAEIMAMLKDINKKLDLLLQIS